MAWEITKRALLLLTFFLMAAPCQARNSVGFSYDEPMLKLRLQNGKYTKFKDGNCDKGFEGCIRHLFKGTIANDQFYLVEERYWEGQQFILISVKSGTKTIIYGEPHLSPNQKLIATAVASESTEANGVYVFDISLGEAKSIFSYEPNGYALYDFGSWISDDEALINLTVNCNAEDHELTVTQAKLIKKLDGWNLDQGAAGRCITPQ